MTQAKTDAGAKTGKPAGKSKFQHRLDNQKAQLDKHGNFAEVMVRTTPEATDMLNFARLWEYVLVNADRQTRGHGAVRSRDEYKVTHTDFEECLAFMILKLQKVIARHELDVTGTNFISRVAQRYGVSDAKGKAATPANES